ncbi:MAG: class I SAM-dependent methyltransferase [Pseudomonadales bacterium]
MHAIANSQQAATSDVAYYCPDCEGAALTPNLAAQQRFWRCGSCLAEYPEYSVAGRAIPWLFPKPTQAHVSWQQRLLSCERGIDTVLTQLTNALQKAELMPLTQQRLTRFYQGNQQLREALHQYLAPLQLAAADSAQCTQPWSDVLPQAQGLLSYRNNLFRDWSWDNGEAAAMLDAVNQILCQDSRRELGRTLTLGAGSGRLSFDLHQQHHPECSVLLDLNPLLTALAANIVAGEDVSMPEFPIAPSHSDNVCCLQPCKLPQGQSPANERLQFVLGDATAPPFAAESFDTVITPWLLDILPLPLPRFLPVINELLPLGGRWVNTGSLAFSSEQHCNAFCPDEVEALLSDAGFELQSFEQQTQQYLHSPLSAHGRTEQVYSFCALKAKPARRGSRRRQSDRPRWLTEPSTPIPIDPTFEIASAQHLLNAQVLGAIDGQRSLDELAELLGRKYQLSKGEAQAAIETILLTRQL